MRSHRLLRYGFGVRRSVQSVRRVEKTESLRYRGFGESAGIFFSAGVEGSASLDQAKAV